MKHTLDAVISKDGVELEGNVEEEMSAIIQKHHPEIESLPMSDFRRIFWNQQVLDALWFSSCIFILMLIGSCFEGEEEN